MHRLLLARLFGGLLLTFTAAPTAAMHEVARIRAVPFGVVNDVVAHGDLVYVMASHTDLHIFDVSEPTAPVEIGSWEGSFPGDQIAVDGALAYAAFSDRFRVFDVGDPTDPQLLSEILLPRRPDDLQVAGGHVFATGSGLQVIDVSDPASPELVAELNPGTSSFEIAIEGDRLAYTGGFSGGLHLVDIQDPAAPVEIGSVPMSGETPLGLALRGDLVYVAVIIGVRPEIRVIDFSDPAFPVELDRVVGGGGIRQLRWSGSTLLRGPTALGAVDVDDPTQLELRGALNHTLNDVFDVAHGYAYVSGFDGLSGAPLAVIDLGDLDVPSLPVSVLPAETRTRALLVDGEVGYAVDEPGGLRVLDVSDPAAPALIGSLAGVQTGRHVVLEGSRLYVGADSGDLVVIDASDPTSPQRVGDVPTGSGEIGDLEVRGGIAYVSDPGYGLRVIDASVPPAADPLIGSLTTAGLVYGFDRVGDTLLLAAGRDGLLSIDVSDPSAPTPIGEFEIDDPTRSPDDFRDVFVRDGIAYIAGGPKGVILADVSSPATPTLISAVDTAVAGWGIRIGVEGDFAYMSVGVRSFGVWVIDVGDPLNPVFEHFVSPPCTLLARDVEQAVPIGAALLYASGTCGLGYTKVHSTVAPVRIDVLPDSDTNLVNLTGAGVLPVAILGSTSFDVSQVEGATLVFGPDAAPIAHPMGPHAADASGAPYDFDADGHSDLLAHFRKQQTGLALGEQQACLRGALLDGTPFEGCDTVHARGVVCGLGFEVALLLPALQWLQRRKRRRST